MITHALGADFCQPGAGGECVFHYLHDGLGSVVGLTDAGSPGDPNANPPVPATPAKLVERYTYDPYGRTFIERWDPTANGGAGGWVESLCAGGAMSYSAYGNPFMWTGQRYDAAVGLYGFLSRVYSPSLGRWVERDPLEYAAGSVNLYAYVLSAPVTWTDPLGFEPDNWHHYYPQAIFRDLVDDLNIDAKENGVMLIHEGHGGKGTGIHPQWDTEWKGRITKRVVEEGKEVTKKWAEGQLKEMKGMKEFKDILAKGKPAAKDFPGKKTGPGGQLAGRRREGHTVFRLALIPHLDQANELAGDDDVGRDVAADQLEPLLVRHAQRAFLLNVGRGWRGNAPVILGKTPRAPSHRPCRRGARLRRVLISRPRWTIPLPRR